MFEQVQELEDLMCKKSTCVDQRGYLFHSLNIV